jgi:hypothetical protein
VRVLLRLLPGLPVRSSLLRVLLPLLRPGLLPPNPREKNKFILSGSPVSS